MKILTFILFFVFSLSFSQSSYRVYYKSDIIIDFDTIKGPEKFKKTFKSSLEKSRLIIYTLEFNTITKASLFKKDGAFSNPLLSSLDLTLINQITDVNGEYYNFEKKLIHDYTVLGKNLKVEISNKVNWNLRNEKKKIGNYNCLKAIGKIQYGKYKGKLIEAWYTLDIPVKYGPKNYYGLPGLILEIKEPNTIFYASKIETSDYIDIKLPNSKKIITEKKADSILRILDKNAESYFGN